MIAAAEPNRRGAGGFWTIKGRILGCQWAVAARRTVSVPDGDVNLKDSGVAGNLPHRAELSDGVRFASGIAVFAIPAHGRNAVVDDIIHRYRTAGITERDGVRAPDDRDLYRTGVYGATDGHGYLVLAACRRVKVGIRNPDMDHQITTGYMVQAPHAVKPGRVYREV